MKLCSSILKHSIQNSNDGHFHFYNSLVLTDAIAFQHTYFRNTPTNYHHDKALKEHDDLPLQNRTNDRNNALLKIVILVASNASTQEITQAIIDSTNLKLHIRKSLCRGTIQLKIRQNDQEPLLLVIDNVIYAPDCLLSLKQLHHQSKEKGQDKSYSITNENTATKPKYLLSAAC
jgi:hypothetical protein